MGESTGIAWCHHTFNPWWGCTKVSAGCANCYAETFSKRTGHDIWGPGKARRSFGDKHWAEPLKWNAAAAKAGVRRRVFCASMADVFDEEAPAGDLERLWALIRETPNLDWLLLTKRPERIVQSLPVDWNWNGRVGYPNVWLGTSVENQDAAELRIPILANVPAVVRFLSCEPLLGPLNLADPEAPLLWDRDGPHTSDLLIHWVIVGGESGPGHRPFDPAWARTLLQQSQSAGSAFFFKQHGGLRPTSGGHLLDGVEHYEFPRVN